MRINYQNFPKSYEINELTKLRNKTLNANKVILDLTNSNPSIQGLSPDLNQFCKDVLDKVDQYNPQPCGIASAREAIANYYGRRFDRNDSSEYVSRIILTSSTSEAYTWLFKLLCERNDKVMIPQPGYPLCEDIAQLERIECLYYCLSSNSGEWVVDRNSVMHGITKGAQALVAINPHNPTGAYLSYDDLSWIGNICAEYGLYLIVDEVFADYVWNKQSSLSSLRYDSLPCLTFLLNGLSKTLALPHLKCSWILVFGSEEIIDEVINHLEFLGDTYLSVNSLVQKAIPKLLLQQEEIQKPIINRLQINLSSMQNVLPNWVNKHQSFSGGWWVLYSLPEGVDDSEFSIKLLREKYTLVHPGYLFGIKEGYVALSLITKPEVFTKGLKFIAELIKEF